MAESSSIPFWQTLLSGILGGVLTISGQLVVQRLQHLRSRDDENWRADKKQLEEFEAYCARTFDVCASLVTVNETSKEVVKNYVDSVFSDLEQERAKYISLLKRFRSLDEIGNSFFKSIERTLQLSLAGELSESEAHQRVADHHSEIAVLILEVDRILGRKSQPRK